MSFYGSSGMTHVWPIRNTPTTLWTWTPPCWTPFGNLTSSLQTKKEQTSTRLQLTTNSCGYSRTGTFSTALGHFLKIISQIRTWLAYTPEAALKQGLVSLVPASKAQWAQSLNSCSLSCLSPAQFSSLVIVLFSTHCAQVSIKL